MRNYTAAPDRSCQDFQVYILRLMPYDVSTPYTTKTEEKT